jgi:hypothetical protein
MRDKRVIGRDAFVQKVRAAVAASSSSPTATSYPAQELWSKKNTRYDRLPTPDCPLG